MTHERESPDQPPPPPPRQTTAYLKDLFKQVGFTIDARRGQNFLVDLNLVELLVKSAAIGPDDVVLEVGTGTGVVTERTSFASGASESAFRLMVTAKRWPRDDCSSFAIAGGASTTTACLDPAAAVAGFFFGPA